MLEGAAGTWSSVRRRTDTVREQSEGAVQLLHDIQRELDSLAGGSPLQLGKVGLGTLTAAAVLGGAAWLARHVPFVVWQPFIYEHAVKGVVVLDEDGNIIRKWDVRDEKGTWKWWSGEGSRLYYDSTILKRGLSHSSNQRSNEEALLNAVWHGLQEKRQLADLDILQYDTEAKIKAFVTSCSIRFVVADSAPTWRAWASRLMVRAVKSTFSAEMLANGRHVVEIVVPKTLAAAFFKTGNHKYDTGVLWVPKSFRAALGIPRKLFSVDAPILVNPSYVYGNDIIFSACDVFRVPLTDKAEKWTMKTQAFKTFLRAIYDNYYDEDGAYNQAYGIIFTKKCRDMLQLIITRISSEDNTDSIEVTFKSSDANSNYFIGIPHIDATNIHIRPDMIRRFPVLALIPPLLKTATMKQLSIIEIKGIYALSHDGQMYLWEKDHTVYIKIAELVKP